MEDLRPTNAADVALPMRIVELAHLRTRDGAPVRVRCEALDEMVVARILRALPGASPPPVAEDEAAAVDGDPDQTMGEFGRFAPALIEAGTVLGGPAGDVRPAFWFTADPGNGALPGRILRVPDVVTLAHTILELGGYLGGAAGAAFHGAGSPGRNGGVGAVAPGEGHGDASVPADGAEARRA